VLQIQTNEHYKQLAFKQYTALDKKAYPIEMATADTAIEMAAEFEEIEYFDFIFFDFPGTVNSEGLVEVLVNMDYIFIPITADKFVLESSLEYAVLLKRLIKQGEIDVKGVYLLWNMVDKREKTALYDIYEKIFVELDLQVLNSRIPNSTNFRKEIGSSAQNAIFRSTMFPIDKKLLKISMIDELTIEFLNIVKNGN
jgi:cellulose biosynthesis protein BcsQ